MSNIINIFAKRIAKTKFARNAIADGADLSVFKEKPNAKTFFGIFLMGISYVMGLPAVGLLGAYSVYYSDLFLILLGYWQGCTTESVVVPLYLSPALENSNPRNPDKELVSSPLSEWQNSP